MDAVLLFIHAIMPAIYMIAAVAVVLKFVMVSRYKGADFALFILSFFKIYTIESRAATSKKRKRYMLCNNIINIWVYLSLSLSVLMLVTWHDHVSNYP